VSDETREVQILLIVIMMKSIVLKKLTSLIC